MHKTEPVPEIVFLPNELEFLKAAAKAWKTKIKDDQTWETWWKIGAALLIVRNNIMHQLRLNEPKGSSYNIAFSRYLNQYFPGLAITKQASYVLWLRSDQQHEEICETLRKEMTPQQRSRVTDPNSMAKRVRAFLREREGGQKPRKPKTATERIRELEAKLAAVDEERRDFEPATVVQHWFEATNIHGIARLLLAIDHEKSTELAAELLRRNEDD